MAEEGFYSFVPRKLVRRDKGGFIAKEKGWKKKSQSDGKVAPPTLSQGHLSKISSLCFYCWFLSAVWDNPLPSFPRPHPCWEAEWEKGKAPCCAGSTGLATTPDPSVGKGNSIPGRASAVLLGPAGPSRGPEGFFSQFQFFPELEKAGFQRHGMFPGILQVGSLV